VIPKIIHYVWFSEKIPEKIQGYINNWQKIMPDYKIIRWNRENFDIHSVKWVEQALSVNKFAFAADYVRLWAIYNYGGIYLDSDVEVLKSFDDLMDLPYFLGREHSKGIIEAAVFGAEQKSKWVKDSLDYYEGRDFILPDGSYSIEPIPHIMIKILSKKYGLKQIKNLKEFDKNSEKIQILPTEFFSPKPWDCEEFTITKNTYAVHYFEKSWNPPKKWHSVALCKIKYVVRKIIGEKRYLNLMWLVYANR